MTVRGFTFDGFLVALIAVVVVAVAFVLGPEGFGRLMRNGVDPATHGDIVWHESLGILVVVLPLFGLGYYVYLRHICPHLPRALFWCPPRLPPTRCAVRGPRW